MCTKFSNLKILTLDQPAEGYFIPEVKSFGTVLLNTNNF